MGITGGFLQDLIRSQGRWIDLRDFDLPENFRIAIDVSTWIHKATQKNGHMLGDERHLSNFGRAALMLQKGYETEVELDDTLTREKEELVETFIAKCVLEVTQFLQNLQETTQVRLLVVLDGQTPPIKHATTSERKNKRSASEMERDRPVDPSGGTPQVESRYKANRQAGAGKHFLDVFDALINGLRESEIPFLVAPYEADAQLAHLQNEKLVDLVITEDSDLVAHGLAVPVLYKLQPADDGFITKGVLIRREDLGAKVPHELPCKFNLLDFSPTLLATLFAASGCDYCSSLNGVGVGKACTSVREAFLDQGDNDKSSAPALERLIRKLCASSYGRGKLNDDEMIAYRDQFLRGLFMFRHAVVYDPKSRHCCHLTPMSNADPEFVSFEPYRSLVQNTAAHKDIVGVPFEDPALATCIAEGWINPRHMQIRKHGKPPEAVKTALHNYFESLLPEINPGTGGPVPTNLWPDNNSNNNDDDALHHEETMNV